jgi:hypothetical protein
MNPSSSYVSKNPATVLAKLPPTRPNARRRVRFQFNRYILEACVGFPK